MSERQTDHPSAQAVYCSFLQDYLHKSQHFADSNAGDYVVNNQMTGLVSIVKPNAGFQSYSQREMFL